MKNKDTQLNPPSSDFLVNEDVWSDEQRSGLRFRMAKMWIPRLISYIKICLVVTILNMCLVTFFTLERPLPLILFSLEDGSTLCANPDSKSLGRQSTQFCEYIKTFRK